MAVAQSETPYVRHDSYLAEFNLAVLSQIRQIKFPANISGYTVYPQAQLQLRNCLSCELSNFVLDFFSSFVTSRLIVGVVSSH